MTEKAIRKCPKCGKLKVERLISGGGGIIFKGSGFYQTDYRSKGYQEAAKKEADSKPKPKEISGEKKATPAPQSTAQKKSDEKK